jgi:hypothetical protein
MKRTSAWNAIKVRSLTLLVLGGSALQLVKGVDIVLPPGGELAPAVEGKHLTMTFRPEDWAALKDQKSFIEFHDEVYSTMVELTGFRPPMPIRGHHALGAWGTASGDGVRVDWTQLAAVMEGFNRNVVAFGMIHEMGHIFDFPFFSRWYVTHGTAIETFANIKLAYAVERLLTDSTPYRINFRGESDQKGAEFVDHFYIPFGVEYLKSETPWETISVDALHAFHHQFVRTYGWDLYKKMFRTFVLMEAKEDGKAPPNPVDPVRIHVVCAVLSKLSGDDLVPIFQKWRAPVTAQDVADVSKTYKLDEVCEKVNQEFEAEFVKGDIHLDPLSLKIKPIKAPGGKTGFTLSTIFGSSANVAIRYTLDGSDPAVAGGQTFNGKPIAAPVGTSVKAVLYVKGKPGPQLTSALVIPDNL